MSRHSQKGRERTWVCEDCRVDNCVACIDVLRSVFTDKKLCRCQRIGHDGEPRDQQILDPETGTVHAPGLTVDKDGRIAR